MVSVPVLSEQMTDVQPRVSTEGRLRTMAFFLAILLVPSARQVVMTAGRPERKHHASTRAWQIFQLQIPDVNLRVRP